MTYCMRNMHVLCALEDNVVLTIVHGAFDSWITRGARSENLHPVFEFPESFSQVHGALSQYKMCKSPSFSRSQLPTVICI